MRNSEQNKTLNHSMHHSYSNRLGILKDFLKKIPFLFHFFKSLYIFLLHLISKNRWKKILQSNEIKLNLGSGNTKGKNGWINVDISGADINHDLTKGVPLDDNTVDAVYSSHVFEHIPFPNKVMNQIESFCSVDTILYLDVPLENPFSFKTLIKRIFQQALLFFLRPKQFFATFGFGMFFHLHEHINYFSEKSIRKLLINHGFNDMSVFIDNKNGYPSVCALARKKR